MEGLCEGVAKRVKRTPHNGEPGELAMSRARTPPGDGPLPSPRRTASGLPRERLYGPADVTAEPGAPGEFPFTRGLYPGGYRERLWTMRQYAGFGTATESNRRFRYLLDQGTTGLSVAFDLPTQIGYDSDDPHSLGEVGRVGVAIDSLEDMELLFDGIPLDRVSTSMTINSTAAILLALYIAVARRRGIAEDSLKGTIQNDILKEYIARGTWIFPPGRRCGLSRMSSPTAPSACPGGTRFPSPATTSVRRVRPPLRRSRSPWQTASSTFAPPGPSAWTPGSSAGGSRSSSPATPIFSRRWPSSDAFAGCGHGS